MTKNNREEDLNMQLVVDELSVTVANYARENAFLKSIIKSLQNRLAEVSQDAPNT
jgi:hypothetical protein